MRSDEVLTLKTLPIESLYDDQLPYVDSFNATLKYYTTVHVECFDNI